MKARKGTWVRAMISSCSTRWDSALPSELTLQKNIMLIVRKRIGSPGKGERS